MDYFPRRPRYWFIHGLKKCIFKRLRKGSFGNHSQAPGEDRAVWGGGCSFHFSCTHVALVTKCKCHTVRLQASKGVEGGFLFSQPFPLDVMVSFQGHGRQVRRGLSPHGRLGAAGVCSTLVQGAPEPLSPHSPLPWAPLPKVGGAASPAPVLCALRASADVINKPATCW